MKKQILALCDNEAEYTRRFCEYAAKKKDIPFEVAAFSSRDTLEEFCRNEDVDLLLVSESSFDITLKEVVRGDIILLRDEEERSSADDQSIYRYQSCEGILREVMNYCVETIPETIPVRYTVREVGIKMIGFYTPVHRSLQTSMAIAVGEALAREHKVLYFNFESFSGWEQRLRRRYSMDISDLVYYLTNARDALFYKLRGMTEKLRNLDYIPPAFSYMDIARITPDQWFDLFSEIERQSDYEYLILDLSENMQGLFDILRSCIKVFTLVREDGPAAAKLYHYEQLLDRTEYQDIKERTVRYKVPLIRMISEDPMSFNHGELAVIARELASDLLPDGNGDRDPNLTGEREIYAR